MSKHTAKVNDGTGGEPVSRTHAENAEAIEQQAERERKLGAVRAVENYERSGRHYRRKGRALNQPIERLPEKGSVYGKFMGIRPLLGRDNNPIMGSFDKPLEFFELIDEGTGEVRQFWSNGGFKGAISLAKVNSGDLIEIESTGETVPHPENPKIQLAVYRIYPIEVNDARA